MAWLQSKPTMIQGEMQVSSPGKNNQYRIPVQVRSEKPVQDITTGEEWAGRAESWKGLKWACRGCLAGSKHSHDRADKTQTEHYSQTSTWRAYFALYSNLPRPYLGYSPVLAQPVLKGYAETGTGPAEGCQTGYSENMTLQGGWRKQGLSVWHRGI